MFQEKPRTPEYWHGLRDHLEQKVAKFSKEMEERFNWAGPFPWFTFAFDWDESKIQARIRRIGLQPEIRFSLGLLIWLDSIALWINRDGTFRQKLQVFEAHPDDDLSQWMIHLWCDWIFRHEIGHFFCGHISRIADTLVEGEPRVSESIDLTRAMEFDADMFAALFFFGFLSQCLEKRIYQDFYGTDDVRAVFWDLGMLFGALFTAFEEIQPVDTAEKTHPPVAVRWYCFSIEGLHTFHRLRGSSVAAEGNCLLNGLVNTLMRLEQIGKGFGPTLLNTSIDVEETRKTLLAAGIDKSRLFRSWDDWLFRAPLPN